MSWLPSTMMDRPLTLAGLLRHGQQVHSRREVVTCTGADTAPRRRTFGALAARAEQLAAALQRLGVGPGDRVGTFQWNNAEHVEAYLAVPSMGAVLHTVNIRLFPEQVIYVINHAEDKVLIVDSSLVPVLTPLLPDLKTVEHVLVVGGTALGADIGVDYDEALAAEAEGYAWADDIDERAAAAMCYTSGTTGNPKGVVYSHRSSYLHAMAMCMGTNLGLAEQDRVLPIVPMFHANAWGLPYGSWLAGATLLLPDRFLAPEPLSAFIAGERPTVSGAVPTVWNDLIRYGETHELELTSLRRVVCGGSAVPQALMAALDDRYGVRMEQAWGMTETSPIAATARPPAGTVEGAAEWPFRNKTGRVVPGVEIRVVGDEGETLPWDGESVGEFEVRGPWITASYYRVEEPAKFHDGWLRTGDVGSLDDQGFLQITDRSKDVIKSGGEWISSVELENALMAHPDVVEAAVIGVPDDRWQERPLACVVRREGADVGAPALRAYLSEHIARWQLPERWAFIDAVPRTSVGKFDKKVLRVRYADNDLRVETLT